MKAIFRGLYIMSIISEKYILELWRLKSCVVNYFVNRLNEKNKEKNKRNPKSN